MAAWCFECWAVLAVCEWPEFQPPAVTLLIGLVLSTRYAPAQDAFTLGHKAAASLGIAVEGELVLWFASKALLNATTARTSNPSVKSGWSSSCVVVSDQTGPFTPAASLSGCGRAMLFAVSVSRTTRNIGIAAVNLPWSVRRRALLQNTLLGVEPRTILTAAGAERVQKNHRCCDFLRGRGGLTGGY